jgi:hypothetical protein
LKVIILKVIILKVIILKVIIFMAFVKKLVLALITCHQDYCNAILTGFPASTTVPLQRVQNVAARQVLTSDLVTT